MKLKNRTTRGLVILIAAFILLVSHDAYTGEGGFGISHALQVGGSYLILYAVVVAATVGLSIRLIRGDFFDES